MMVPAILLALGWVFSRMGDNSHKAENYLAAILYNLLGLVAAISCLVFLWRHVFSG